MRYVIIRDDDTNALTPVECLERLYRPFLDRGLPVNLATIPNVSTRTTIPDGQLEGFLLAKNGNTPDYTADRQQPDWLNIFWPIPGFKVLQHGFHHDYFEFDRNDREEIQQRLDDGTRLLTGGGFPQTGNFCGSVRQVFAHQSRGGCPSIPSALLGLV